MRTKVEEESIETANINKAIYNAFNTTFNEPKLPKFSFEEVVPFLEKRGYRIVLAKGMGKTSSYVTDVWEQLVTQIDKGYSEVENVFARKENEEIPLDFTSDKANKMLIKNVFIRELKHKILFE